MEPAVLSVAIWATTLLAAAFSDMRSFRIPNLLPAILLVLFAVHHGFAGYSAALWPNLTHFALALVIGMVLFARGWVGGGDAKLYAAAALWFNWSGAVTLLFMTTLAGLLLAMIYVTLRMTGLRRANKDAEAAPKRADRRIPYGVAIAVGALLNVAWVGWNAVFPAISL
jgi:prepilin peptidase CpaA